MPAGIHVMTSVPNNSRLQMFLSIINHNVLCYVTGRALREPIKETHN